ncbi:hopanoid-associated sugar epimerase [Alicyclobacillus kakegawensis]|uniref:hopanoid-associated sugar epimerase n=1 Tax=Alicyclobacillus kakegawensis TaxID=392012 RepID=UPI00082D26D6|nr:hopanoid-associated sugar epimerase [Alicyclobacillus kakegawensis]
MRAFVTGASGFIGYHVARVLRQHGWQVRALVRTPEAVSRLSSLDVEVVPGDLATGEGLEHIHGCETVFHVAALYSLNRRDGPIMYQVNVEGTRRLLEACERARVERVVYTSSTSTVALLPGGEPADERGFAHPDEVDSDYKKSKILAEQVVLQACERGLDAVVVNPSTPVGPGDVKPTPTGKIILDIVRGRMPGYADTGLNVVAVEDVAEGHLLALARGQRGQRYILGGDNMHFRDLVARTAQLAGRPVPRLRVPLWLAYAAAAVDEWIVTPVIGRGPRIPVDGVKLARKPMYFSTERARRELGYSPSSVDAALARAVAWFQQEYPEQRERRRRA